MAGNSKGKKGGRKGKAKMKPVKDTEGIVEVAVPRRVSTRKKRKIDADGEWIDPNKVAEIQDVDEVKEEDEPEPIPTTSAKPPCKTSVKPVVKRSRKKKPGPKRKVVRKAKVTDLSVSLGLEKPPPQVPKVNKEQLNEEELQELRYQEELHKLSNLEQVISLSKVRDHESDDSSVEGDAGVLVGLGDDEEDGLCTNGASTCPRPLPRRRRGGHNKMKKKLSTQVSKEEVKEMCQIIRGSMRRSLTAKEAPLALNDEDIPDSDTEDLIEMKSVEKENSKEEKGTEASGSYIVYPALQEAMASQDQWISDMNAESTPVNEYARRMCSVNVRRRGLERQLYIEHLSWVALASKADQVSIAEGQALAWVPSFQRRLKFRYPALAGDPTPRSGSELDMILQITVLKVTEKLDNVMRRLLCARAALKDLKKHVVKVYHDKLEICKEFERVHDELNIRSAKYDESSVWGLKPIRLALEPPYFKTEDGYMSCPMTPDAEQRMKEYGFCFFKRDKQKWTTKDLQQLKVCIKEALFSKRMNSLNDRYEVLMSDCLRQYERDMSEEGRFDAPPLEASRRKPGRPKKSELEYSSKYGIINPVIWMGDNGAYATIEVTPRALAEWRTSQEKILKTQTYEELVLLKQEKIDWAAVANKMVVKSKKPRTADDCDLAFRHEVHPKVNDKRWGAEESRRLKEIYGRVGNDWVEVAKELNAFTDLASKPGRTPYQCFFRVRNRLDPPKKVVWTNELDQQVLDRLKEYPGNWRMVAASIEDPAATKRQLIERYKKVINPVLRNGAFTRVEDCLLILAIEKLKPFLAREGHFGCLLAFLPWRCETTWRDRANNLFSDWIVPWTLEEDKMLLELAKTMKRNWQKISEEFTSFKNRKGCLTRYKILMNRLKDPRFNNSLEAYHEAYAMTRYNVFQYKHLKEILQLLTKVQGVSLPEENRHFPGLLRDREPSEVRLQHMLLTFDREILNSAITSLTRYVVTRDNYWKKWISEHGERRRTFDRRTFHPDNPQSVASALHIRGLELKPKEEVSKLSDFEEEIYKFYARFRRTKALKVNADRPYIPDAKTLAQWYAVSRLIETPVNELEDVPLKRKWKALKTENQIGQFGGTRKNKEVKRPRLAVKIPKKTSDVGRLRKKHTRKAKPVEPPRKPVSTNEEGYILIPPEPNMEQALKRGRARKKDEETDPEFVAEVSRNDEVAGTSFGHMASRPRRSRGPRKRYFDNDPDVESD